MVAALAWAAGPAASPAHADGDPASDVLADQSLFVPWDAHIPAQQEVQIAALLSAADRDGDPMRVAVIASASDLGSVGALWRKPQIYARFLGDELSLVYHGALLVVMPNGFGLDHQGLSRATVRSSLAGIPVPRDGVQLADDTLIAVRRLAAASGHPLRAQSVTVQAVSDSADFTAWVAFAIGCALTALAWTLSLRAQGLRTKRRDTSHA